MKFRIGTKRRGDIRSFKRLFPDILSEYEIEKLFTVETLASHWKEIAGDLIATHSIPDRIYKSVLFIAVDHPVFGNEIMLMKDSILKRIADVFGPGLVRSIKTEIKPLTWIQSR